MWPWAVAHRPSNALTHTRAPRRRDVVVVGRSPTVGHGWIMIREGENSGTCSVYRPVGSMDGWGDSARVDAGPRVVMGRRGGSDRPTTGHLQFSTRSIAVPAESSHVRPPRANVPMYGNEERKEFTRRTRALQLVTSYIPAVCLLQLTGWLD